MWARRKNNASGGTKGAARGVRNFVKSGSNRDPALLFARSCSFLPPQPRSRPGAAEPRFVKGVRRPMGLLNLTRIGRPAYLAAAALALVFAGPAAAQTSIKFSLDGRLEGPEALVLLPQDKGYFKSEGLDVTRRRRGLSARTDHPRRERQLRHGLCRYQRAHQIPRPEPVGSGQSRIHGLQQAALCDRGPQEPRHHRAQAAREQETGRAACRRNLRAMAAVRQAQQYRRVEGHDREHRDSGASTHARGRSDRRRAWLFVPALCRSQGPRRAARRHRPDADGGLRD